MKSFKLSQLLAGAALAVAIGIGTLFPVPEQDANAATPNFAVGVGYDMMVIPLHISGQYGATTTAVARFTLPFARSMRCAVFSVTIIAWVFEIWRIVFTLPATCATCSNVARDVFARQMRPPCCPIQIRPSRSREAQISQSLL